jgi:hypothetical protein
VEMDALAVSGAGGGGSFLLWCGVCGMRRWLIGFLPLVLLILAGHGGEGEKKVDGGRVWWSSS